MQLTILKRTLLVSMFLLVSSNMQATEKDCSKNEAVAAETEAGTLKNWQDIYQSYKKYHQCDDGGIAEGYSDSITLLLAKHWESLKELKRHIAIDKGFLKFVLKHIDATTNPDDVRKVYINASKHCPKGCSKLCLQIKKQTKDALREF
jgi:hypothetical protein